MRMPSLSLSPPFIPRRVVVTGLGLVTPLGVGVRRAWNNLLQGQSGVVTVTGDAAGFPESLWTSLPSRVAAFVPRRDSNSNDNSTAEEGTFDPGAFDAGQNRMMSLGTKYGLVASAEALADARWPPANSDRDDPASPLARTGVAVGMAMVEGDYIADCHNLVCNGQAKKMGPYFVPRILTNLVAGHISIRHGFRGPNHSVATACATGSHAIGDAYRIIQMGSADVMVCGGVEACISPLNVAGFCRARALSTRRNETPREASRPFDQDRDGFVMGEGAGVLVLEELGHARERKAEIYGEVVGYGMSGDAEHITAGRKDGEGALQAMRDAFRFVGGEEALKDLWCVNAHATSTPLGDLAEVIALGKLLGGGGRIKKEVYVTSNKGNLGHLLGAAGSVESIFALLGLKEGVVPRNINVDHLEDCKSDCLRILTENVDESSAMDDKRRRLVLKNSFGFGGTNVSLLFANHS